MQELQAGDPALIGPYRVVGRLGSGGMGHVFLGRSPGGRLLAIKVIRAELAGDPEFRIRFRREVAAARSVSGLFTAPVVDADLDAPVPWLATAYIAGSSLADTVVGQGPLPAAAVLALAAGLSEGLLAIHSAGLVHRDLKPSNVLMAEDGPRVIDFGISRAMEASTVTSTGMMVGSPGFMSPEQAEGREVGPSSDVFSLGAVLAFAATGEGPFGNGSSVALIYRLVHNPPDLGRVPIQTRSLIERCLDKDPGRRPSPRELLAELGGGDLERGWLPPESLVPDLSSSGPATPVPSLARSAPPTFGSPLPGSPPPGSPPPSPSPWDMITSGARTGAPADPPTVPPEHLNRSVVPPLPGGYSDVMPPPGSRPPGRRAPKLAIVGLVAALVAVAGGVSAAVLIAGGKHSTAQGASKARALATALPSLSSAASLPGTQREQVGGGKRNGHGTPTGSPTATATAAATSSAKASPTARATKQGSGLNPSSLNGAWTGTYFCPQGWTGLRLVLTATSSGSLTATFSFYPTASNLGVPSGSFVLTGSYSAKGFQLTPDHWISKPEGYSMVGLTASAPSENDTVLNGDIVSPGCTTFSVSR